MWQFSSSAILRCRAANTLIDCAFYEHGTAGVTPHSFIPHHRECGIGGSQAAGSRARV
jgi:hypothetical protein